MHTSSGLKLPVANALAAMASKAGDRMTDAVTRGRSVQPQDARVPATDQDGRP